MSSATFPESLALGQEKQLVIALPPTTSTGRPRPVDPGRIRADHEPGCYPGGLNRTVTHSCSRPPWSTTTLNHTDRPGLKVTATPCRHGPPLSRPIVGQVIGFVIQAARGGIWVTGDTVKIPALGEVPRRFDIDTMIMHLGRVQFGATGALRYSMDGHDAKQLVRMTRPRRAIPVHYEGWSHFAEGVDHLHHVLVSAGPDVAKRIVWLPAGVSTRI